MGQTWIVGRGSIAEYIGLTISTLDTLLEQPDPPPVYRVGHLFRARADELEAWLQTRRVGA